MTNHLLRGSAPGRARPAYLRPGSFERGHEKRGGRKRGTPNLFSIDYRKAILEAAYRIGQDGNGKNGASGYFKWVGERHPGIFYTVLLCGLLPLENAEGNMLEEQRPTIDETDQWVREYIGPARKNGTVGQIVQVESSSPWSWTGQDYPVGGLMELAIENPKAFCKLFVAAFLRPPTRRG
jgi:hypothetical protein